MSGNGSYPASARTRPSRHPERVSYDRTVVHAILDDARVGHLGFVADGAPVVLPMLHVRIGEELFLHGSTGARSLLSAAGGPMRVCYTVTLVDGLVLARAAFNHSVNYRSVAVHGDAIRVGDPAEQRRALDALVDHVVPGRLADCRAPTGKELAATALLRLPLVEVSAKVRTGDPKDEPADLDLPYWAGVLPLTEVPGRPAPAADLRPGRPVPGYLSADSRAKLTSVDQRVKPSDE